MSIGGTSSHSGQDGLPPLVRRALAAARAAGFDTSCSLAHGRLLGLLAAGRPGGRIAEAGTGLGLGLAWLASGADLNTSLVSVEINRERAAQAQKVFAETPNVTVLCGDWAQLADLGPFDLLSLDAGGLSKHPTAEQDPVAWLTPGGMVVIDDFSPTDDWPPRHDGVVDAARLWWWQHPELSVAEVHLDGTNGPAVTLLGSRKFPA